ncbi:exonuclease [Syntrophotalea acetylenivorans]|uniref:Exonuclease n=1 Tax=Syntrophotalea acetylenivorans TaxID=1842532 RepID=A0A1L3GRD1_9BACT|nr:recombination-associated protein RdgC [Syntrophotalea acetylenivorans]APG28499.1 exonuclease [Syntrophotalea acetylenivorans]
MTFTLRRDRRRVPAGLLKAHLERAEAEFLAANPGLNRVPKPRREELRDAVRGALLAKTLPTPTTFDAVWDTRRNLLTLATLNGQVIEEFEALFKTTFDGLRLVTLHPYARAQQSIDEALQPALTKANQATNDTVLDLIQDNRWLGWEFLCWLVDRTMNTDSNYKVNVDGPAQVGEGFVAYINDRLVLEGEDEEGKQKVTVAGPQNKFDEVLAALENRKSICEATLYLEKEELLWKLTLKGELFQFGSFRCPSVKLEKDDMVDEEREKEALFLERMYLLESGLQLFDSLFATFLQQHLTKNG